MMLSKIKQGKRKFENFIRKKAHSDSAFSHLINFAFRFFSSGIISAIISIIGTVVIAIMVGCSYYEMPFVLVCVVFCVLVVLSGWANDYAKQKNDDAQHFYNALIQLKSALRSWAVAKQKVAKKFQKIDLLKDTTAVSGALSDIDFQTAAFIICEKLAQFLEGIDKSGKAYVTVYQRIKPLGSDSEVCRMIAYSSNHEPKSYSTIYPIPTDPTEGIEFHSYIFSSGQTETIVLSDMASVKSKFKSHNGCEKRESDICQYVGIPIAPAKLGVTFLLQADVSTPNLLGNSEESVKEFADNTIRPFADFLHMIYEDGRLIEQMLNGVIE